MSSVEPSIDVACTTSRAPSKSAAAIVGASLSRWRPAARSPASRTRARMSAATKPGVRPAISSKATSCDRGTLWVATSSRRSRCRRSGSAMVSSWSRVPGARRAGSTRSGWAVVQTTAARPSATTSRTAVSSTVDSGPGRSRGAMASTSTTSTTAGASRVARVSASTSCLAAASVSVAARVGAHSVVTFAPTAWATAATRAALPEPDAPVSSTPIPGEVPSRASRSRWWNPSSSHSCSRAPCDSSPGRSAKVRTASAVKAATGGALGVGPPVVVVPSRHPTTVPSVTITGPVGSASTTCSSSVVQPAPTHAVRLRRSEAKSVGGASSLGLSDTASPGTTTLPSSAVRRIVGSSVRAIRSSPVTVMRRASTRAPTSTTTVSPSRRPRLDSSRSSHSALPGGQSSGARTASAPTARVPRRSTTLPSAIPSPDRACSGSLTIPCRS